MKVLVTGGCGFMGSDFVREAVKKGFDITVVDKLTYAGDIERIKDVYEKIDFFKIDIASLNHLREVFDAVKPNVVIHYAAETHVDRSILQPERFVKTNVLGTYNLLELSKRYEVERFIHISTDEVYGELPKQKDLKFKETDPLKPKSPYSASKAGAEHMVFSFINTYHIPATVVRASNNYGEWQYPEKLIPLTTAKVLLNEKIPVYGDGKNVRTWLYVRDFTEAVFTVIEKGKTGEVYNIGSNEERENIEVVNGILSLLDKDESLLSFVPDRPGHDLRYALDITKAEKELGWRAKTSFEEGLERTIHWYKENSTWLFKKKKVVERFVNKLINYFSQRER